MCKEDIKSNNSGALGLALRFEGCGERPGPDSDIDLLAIADRGDDVLTAILLVDEVAKELGVPRPIVSIKVHDPSWLEGRRRIDSFFIADVDRDKVVLYGEP